MQYLKPIFQHTITAKNWFKACHAKGMGEYYWELDNGNIANCFIINLREEESIDEDDFHGSTSNIIMFILRLYYYQVYKYEMQISDDAPMWFVL